MTDRELLEFAAKAAGLNVHMEHQAKRDACGAGDVGLWIEGATCWNPLIDDGNAFRLAVKLEMSVCVYATRTTVTGDGCFHEVYHESDSYATTRRAIVRAAAEVGKAMP